MAVHRPRARYLGQRTAAAAAASLALVGAAFAAPASADVGANRNLELNQSIEMGVLEGYPMDSTVLVEVLRGNTLIAFKNATITDLGNKGETIYDINHIGGGDCWEGAGGGTPDIQAGDKVVATVLDPVTGAKTADSDYMFVRDVQFTEAGSALTGHARGVEAPAGTFNLLTPISLGDPAVGDGILMEAKRVGGSVDAEHAFAPGDLAADGTFTGVPLEGTGGEVFIDTVETTANAGGEGTGITVSFPSDEPGEAPCGEPVTSGLTTVSQKAVNKAMLDAGTPLNISGPRLLGSQTPDAGDADVTVDALTLNGQDITDLVQQPDGVGTWSASIPATTLAGLTDNAEFTLVATFSDGTSATRSVLKDASPAVITASPGDGGSGTGELEVSLFVNDAAPLPKAMRYTTDGSQAGEFHGTVYGAQPFKLGAGQRTVSAWAEDRAGNITHATFRYNVASVAANAQPQPQPLPPTVITPTTNRNRRLVVLGLNMRSVLSRSAARRSGVTAKLRLERGTKVVEARVFKGRRLIGRVVRNVDTTRSRNATVRLNSAAIRRALARGGSYQLRVRAGESRTRLGESSIRNFRVR